MKSKLRVLCVCAQGRNRSRYLANYLRNLGYSTSYGGVEAFLDKIGFGRELNQRQIDWADVIITMRPRHAKELRANFKVRGKKIIRLNVTDSYRTVVMEHPKYAKFLGDNFHKKWTYPQLRKAIKSYLPLKK